MAGALPSTRRAQTVNGLTNKPTLDDRDQVSSLAEPRCWPATANPDYGPVSLGSWAGR